MDYDRSDRQFIRALRNFFFGASIEVRRSTGPHTFVEAANVMLTHYQGPLKLKDWALAIR